MTAPLWGYPWHGRFVESAGEPYLQRNDGTLWPLFDANGTYLPASTIGWLTGVDAQINGLGPTATGSVTHQVRVNGHEWAGRTPEEQAADALLSREWLGAAMIVDTKLHGLSLNVGTPWNPWLTWVYSLGGQCWLIRARATQYPRPGTSTTEARDLVIALEARRFGLIGVEAEWETVATVSAPTCCTASFPWTSINLNNPTWSPIWAQSIRSDGGDVIVEASLGARAPARWARGAYGFYRLSLARVDGAWTAELQLLRRDSEIYSKSLDASALRASSDWVGSTISNPDENTTVEAPYVLATPVPNTTNRACTGVLYQEQTRHCGFVFDAADDLHEIACRYRVEHHCDVDRPVPTVGGELRTVSDGGTVTVTDDTWSRYEGVSEVTSLLIVEVLRDGVVASSVQAELLRRKTWTQYSYHPDPVGAPNQGAVDTTCLSYWRLTLGDFVAEGATAPDGIPGDWLGGTAAELFPWAGLFDGSFIGWPLGSPVPWSSATWGTPGTVALQPLLRFASGSQIQSSTIALGAARLANNVWVPFIQAGRNTGYQQWTEVVASGTDIPISGIPPAIYGPRVGPDVNGPAPVNSAVSLSVSQVEPGSYDYLHGIVLPYGAVY